MIGDSPGLWAVPAAVLAEPAFLLAALATALAGVMRGYAGFGTAVLLAPVFATLWGPRAGVPVMLLMELLVSVQLLPRALGEADRRSVLALGLAATVSIPFGAWVLLHADAEMLRRGIGAFVLGFGLLLLSPWRYRGGRTLPLNLAVGAASGVLKGATGMGGPPVILYLLSGPEEARRHRANLILFFALIGVVAILPPALGGLIGAEALWRAALLLPVLLGAVAVGVRLFGVVPARWYRPFALLVLVSAGGLALLA